MRVRSAFSHLSLACTLIVVGCAGPTRVMDADAAPMRALKRRCANEGQGACVDLGIAYATGKSVEQNLNWAKELFERACNDKNPAACGELGQLFYNGSGVPQDVPHGVRLYDEACQASDWWSCKKLGELYSKGEKVTADAGRSAAAYERACKQGNDAWSCVELGLIIEKGSLFGRGLSESAELYSLGCKLKDMTGCLYAADMLADGRGVPKSLEAAMKLYQAICSTGNEEACKRVREQQASHGPDM